MINFARQAYVNPFLSTVSTPFGGVNPQIWGQPMGLVPTPFSYLPMTAQFGQYNPLAAQLAAQIASGQIASGFVPGINRGDVQMTGQYNQLLSQIAAGIVPGITRSDVQMTGQFNPFGSQLPGGLPQTINPFSGQTATNWPGSTHLSQQGVGDRTSAYGIDPRVAFGATGQQIGQQYGQQLGWADPNVVAGLNNPGLAADPISLLVSQQLNPLVHQQLPIRSLINTPQNAGFQPTFQQGFQPSFQQGFPGVGPQAAQAPLTQWPVAQPIVHLDPYRAFIEAQLISQLATNPLYQVQHQLQPLFQPGYGAQQAGLGVPGVGQQFNPYYGNAPFCG